MGETQIYSQRLHGINEKRRILSEVDRIQRELDQQKVKLHQLKRKSLRDRWLMEGLVPTAAAETENPISETEGHIKDLELQLERFQLELTYLENPELKTLKAAKEQSVILQKELVNGERNLQRVDKNESLKEHPIAEEANQQGDSQGEKPAVSEEDLTSSTKEVDAHSVPAPQCKIVSEIPKVEHNLDLEPSNSNEPDDKQTHPSQNVGGTVPQNADDSHKSVSEENENQNLGHGQELQDQKEEHKSGSPQELSLDVKSMDVESIPNQNHGSLEDTLEQEDQNLRNPVSELGRVSYKTDDSQQTSSKEELNDDLFKQNHSGKESLLDEITKLVNLGEQDVDKQNHDDNKPYLSNEQLDPESLLMDNTNKNSQNLEGTNDEELALSLETERAHLVLLDSQEETEKPMAVCMEIEAPEGLNQCSIVNCEVQTLDSAPLCLENTQSSVLPLSDQEVHTTLPCSEIVPSQSLTSGGQNQVDQVQISQVLVVSAPGHEQRSSNSAQGPSASHQPQTRETSTAPESQPLLQKAQETDTHHGANTAETRDKSTPTKKKTCQCCVIM